jgi:large subunit ribosomal protein L4e
MAARPLVTLADCDETVKLPDVLLAPIRPDIVHSIHTNMNKNHRQAYAVFKKAGHQTAAESWGTGRAVSRIPRVPGGGTHRAGQGAFGNMCRGGHMYSPTKIWRRWHRKINIKQKRYAVCSALAASALPSLVMARGHKIDNVPEVPLVVSDSAEHLTQTKKALELLKKIGALADVTKSKDSKNLHKGKGKMRNRRYTMRRGPLMVFSDTDSTAQRAFRNIPGVEVASVESLNLLQLAPGGHLGRFCIWTKSAFQKLDSVFGTATVESQQKKGFKVPRCCMTNSDLNRVINSDEIQTVVKPPNVVANARAPLKKNPLKNLGALMKLNPYAKTARRIQIIADKARVEAKAKKLATRRGTPAPPAAKAAGKKFYQGMIVDSQYEGELFEGFSSWLTRTDAPPAEEAE